MNDPESGMGVVGRHGSCPDPLIYDLVRRSSSNHHSKGQHHLLYRKGKAHIEFKESKDKKGSSHTTRLILRRIKPEHSHLPSTTHIYAIRSADVERPEQRPKELIPEAMGSDVPDINIAHAVATATPATTTTRSPPSIAKNSTTLLPSTAPLLADMDPSLDPYTPAHMAPQPRKPVADWVCVNDELDIYVCDTGLTPAECDQLVQISEQVCKGHYAAYTYAKQTLGCREFPGLAHACYETVHRVTHAIWDNVESNRKLQLDDREPHIVKYDVTKKERQKLDMHTDKSEWTFLIALSDGCGLDYEGGGTYFEALDATVHVQRGHALIFPGKLRHCGQRITKGLRFLLVGFLVDKTNPNHLGGPIGTISPPTVIASSQSNTALATATATTSTTATATAITTTTTTTTTTDDNRTKDVVSSPLAVN